MSTVLTIPMGLIDQLVIIARNFLPKLFLRQIPTVMGSVLFTMGKLRRETRFNENEIFLAESAVKIKTLRDYGHVTVILRQRKRVHLKNNRN